MRNAFGLDDASLLPSGWLTTRMFALDVKTRDQAVRWLNRLPLAPVGALQTHFDIVRAPPYQGHVVFNAALFVDLMREQGAPFTLHRAPADVSADDGVRIGFAGEAFRLGDTAPTGEPLGPQLEPDAAGALVSAA